MSQNDPAPLVTVTKPSSLIICDGVGFAEFAFFSVTSERVGGGHISCVEAVSEVGARGIKRARQPEWRKTAQ